MKRFLSSYHFFGLVAIVFWSTSYVFTKLVVDVYSSSALAFLRIFVASIFMALVLTVRKTPRPPLRELHRFILPGLLGFSIYYYLFNKGTTLTNPTTVVIAIAAGSVYTPVLARIFQSERLRPAGWLAILLAFAGILVMTLWDGTMQLNAGVLWCTGAAVSLALYNLLQRGLARSYSPLQINAYSFFVSIVPMLVFLPDAVRELSVSPWWKTLIVIYMGIFPSAISYLAWVKSLSMAPRTSATTNYMFLTPLLTAVLEFTLMGLWPDAPTIVGGAVILFSLALFSYAGKKE